MWGGGGGGSGGGDGGGDRRQSSKRVAMPDPRALGVVEPVRQPLRLQELEPVLAQVQWLAASGIDISSPHYMFLYSNAIKTK